MGPPLDTMPLLHLRYAQACFYWVANASRLLLIIRKAEMEANDRDGFNVNMCCGREAEMETVETEMAGGP